MLEYELTENMLHVALIIFSATVIIILMSVKHNSYYPKSNINKMTTAY